MREILFRGKRTDNGEWVYGYYTKARYYLDKKEMHIIFAPDGEAFPRCEFVDYEEVIPETVGQYTGLTDKNGKRIFEGDIVRYNTYDDFDCQSVAKFGEYNQDGSAGEYSASKCIGFYVDVDNFTCPDLCEYGSNCFSNYLKQQNILEVAQYCEIIGNIHDNPELME